MKLSVEEVCFDKRSTVNLSSSDEDKPNKLQVVKLSPSDVEKLIKLQALVKGNQTRKNIAVVKHFQHNGNEVANSGHGSSKDGHLALKTQHWLERRDSKHRYGVQLREYYEEWIKIPNADENFFAWLDEGEGRICDV